MEAFSRRYLLACAGLVLTTLFWAGNAVLARALAGEIPPVALTFWRWVLALIILLPFGLSHVYRQRREIRRHWLALSCLGVLSVGVFNTVLYLAAHTTTAINITLVNATMPVAVAVMALLLLGQRSSRGQLIGFVVAAVGVVSIVARGRWSVLTDLAFHPGDLLMVLAITVWGVYSVLLRRWPVPIHPVGFLTVMVIVGTVFLVPIYLAELWFYGGFEWAAHHSGVFLYLAIFPAILAFLFWNHGVKVVGPAGSAMFIYLMPVFTAVLGSVLLGEALHGYHAFGGLLILCGLYLSTRRA